MPRSLLTIALSAMGLFLIAIVWLKNIGAAHGLFAFFSGVPYHDKIGHFGLMGLLSLLAVLALAGRIPRPPITASALVIAGVTLIVGLEELSQHWVANRTCSSADMLCSLAGIIVFGIAGHWARFRAVLAPSRAQ